MVSAGVEVCSRNYYYRFKWPRILFTPGSFHVHPCFGTFAAEHLLKASPRRAPRHPNPPAMTISFLQKTGPVRIPSGKFLSSPDIITIRYVGVGLAEDLQLQDPKRADASCEKEEAISLALSVPSALVSPPISGSTVCTCPDRVHSNVVRGTAAVMHLVGMVGCHLQSRWGSESLRRYLQVQGNYRIVADLYQNASQRGPFDNNTLR